MSLQISIEARRAWLSDLQIIIANLEIAAEDDWKYRGALKAARELERDLKALRSEAVE